MNENIRCCEIKGQVLCDQGMPTEQVTLKLSLKTRERSQGKNEEHNVMPINTDGAQVELWVELCSFRKLKKKCC